MNLLTLNPLTEHLSQNLFFAEKKSPDRDLALPYSVFKERKCHFYFFCATNILAQGLSTVKVKTANLKLKVG